MLVIPVKIELTDPEQRWLDNFWVRSLQYEASRCSGWPANMPKPPSKPDNLFTFTMNGKSVEAEVEAYLVPYEWYVIATLPRSSAPLDTVNQHGQVILVFYILGEDEWNAPRSAVFLDVSEEEPVHPRVAMRHALNLLDYNRV